MVKKRVLLVIGLLIILIVISGFYYINHFSNSAALRNIVHRNGYSVNILKESIETDFFIKPEWIPFDSGKTNNLKVKVCTKNNTDIILTQVTNNDDNIYFSFDTSYHLNYNKGEFLYNELINEDDTFTSDGSSSDFILYNSKNEPFNVGGSGDGPNSAFGFGVIPEDNGKIKNGFYVKYTGMKLYSYIHN